MLTCDSSMRQPVSLIQLRSLAVPKPRVIQFLLESSHNTSIRSPPRAIRSLVHKRMDEHRILQWKVTMSPGRSIALLSNVFLMCAYSCTVAQEADTKKIYYTYTQIVTTKLLGIPVLNRSRRTATVASCSKRLSCRNRLAFIKAGENV